MEVQKLTHSFSDLMVVNAARVSFNKFHDTFDDVKDTKLINYLLKHDHWSPVAHPHADVRLPLPSISIRKLLCSPELLAGIRVHKFTDEYIDITGSAYALLRLAFEHDYIYLYFAVKDMMPATAKAFFEINDAPFNMDKAKGQLNVLKFNTSDKVLSFRVSAPIFVARQLAKHQLGLVWNEVSRRYVDYAPDMYMMDKWRLKPTKDKKQGSGGDSPNDEYYQEYQARIHNMCSQAYQQMTELDDIAPEQARIILPQSTYTEWIWTGYKDSFERVIKLRTKEDAQSETRYVINKLRECM